MSEQTKSRWQKEFDALPEWAQKMVRGLADCPGYGVGRPPGHYITGMRSERRKTVTMFHVLLADGKSEGEFFDGFCEMKALAAAMTAPWPPPPAPVRERRVVNLVEMIASDDCAFDQKCAFGHRVETHAVYCHNEAWSDFPRRCRRGEWMADIYGGNPTDYRHEDCPGFVANPDFKEPSA